MKPDPLRRAGVSLWSKLPRKTLGRWGGRVVRGCGEVASYIANPLGTVIDRCRKTLALWQRTVRKKAGSTSPHRLAINGDMPFSEFWKEDEHSRNYTDTVDHKVMMVSERARGKTGIDGKWHVKGPGKESRGTRLKRSFQRFLYFFTGQLYKGLYYIDSQLLIQKEVVATNLYRAAKLASDTSFGERYQSYYTYDKEQKRHYGAFKHLDHFKEAKDIARGSQFSECHNPATELVLRRFFLGDEDYLKLDNYMYAPSQDGPLDVYSIDFGMALFNKFNLPGNCTFEAFKKRLLRPSKKHRLQYRNSKTLLTLLGSNVDEGLKKGLAMIANLSDSDIQRQCQTIGRHDVRESLIEIMKWRRNQARFISGFSGEWPPRLITTRTMNRLV